MPLSETLARVEREIAAKDLGRARDRLTGLVGTYPNDLSLRRRLAEVYWTLGDRAMAGRYWYLEEDRTEEMHDAITAFEHSHGGDGELIRRALKFRGDASRLPERLSTLLEPHAGRRATDRNDDSASPFPGFRYGCMAALALAATFAMIGFVTVLRWLF